MKKINYNIQEFLLTLVRIISLQESGYQDILILLLGVHLAQIPDLLISANLLTSITTVKYPTSFGLSVQSQ